MHEQWEWEVILQHLSPKRSYGQVILASRAHSSSRWASHRIPIHSSRGQVSREAYGQQPPGHSYLMSRSSSNPAISWARCPHIRTTWLQGGEIPSEVPNLLGRQWESTVAMNQKVQGGGGHHTRKKVLPRRYPPILPQSIINRFSNLK